VGKLRADVQHGRTDQCRNSAVDTMGPGILGPNQLLNPSLPIDLSINHDNQS